jgi:holo-[acyl-carrier protein] synthase
MIYGIGVDIVDVDRFEKSLQKTPGLLDRLFSDSEKKLPINSLAARFAAKEALMKAIGKPDGLSFVEVEILNNENGAPYFSILGKSKETTDRAGIQSFRVSLSHDGGFALAYVIAESK